MLHTEPTALPPGRALLLPDDDFSMRCSYIDFDGDEAVTAWRADRPETETEKQAFVKTHFGLMVKGVNNIRRYLGAAREGRKPEHVGALDLQPVGS